MAILGMYDGHNSCAAVISEETGQIVAAVEEERFSRIKNHDSRPPDVPGPVRSAAFCVAMSDEPINHLAVALASPDDLERLCVNAFLDAVRTGARSRLDSVAIAHGDYYDLLRMPRSTQLRRFDKCLRTLADAGVRIEQGVPAVHHVPHHLAHAASAFLHAPSDQALVVVLDGMGDGLSGLVARGRGHRIEPLVTIDAAQSLGHLYSAFTEACGFQVLRHEGKITALAAAGVVDPELYGQLAELFQFDRAGGGLVGGLSVGLPLGPYPHRLVDEYHDRVKRLVAGVATEDAAATVQRFTEDIVAELVSYHLGPAGTGTVALAGGVFANVSLNRRLAELDHVERLYVHPAMSDAGLAVGAASQVYATLRGRRPSLMRDAFLGPEYGDAAAVAPFREAGFGVLSGVRPEDHLANALAEGHVVARFVGRAEYGPRALGNRSVLAPCDDPAVPEELNRMLKRSTFMPFAPITLATDADRMYRNLAAVSWSARYMTVAVDCTAEMRAQSPAAVHRDRTARPQLVGPDNPGLHHLLLRYQGLTGSSTLINTSLNIHEEPMALTPADAVRSVVAAGIDVAQVGGLVCTRL